MSKKIPEQIGKYRILGTLGRGGMGDVYKAMQEPLCRTVALKVLPEEYSRNEDFLRRFNAEAKAISQLEHQNIVGIYDYGVEENLRYIAMRYIEGINLAEQIDKEKTLSIDMTLDYARQICRALKYAHERDIVHRDIKPQNILIQNDGKLFVTDFGIAKMYEQTGFTKTGVVVGTPEYMSPEQAEGIKLNGQTDLYSLGIVMYEMLTGVPPFTGENPLSIAYKHVNLPPPPVMDKRKDIPKRLELLILKALKKDRNFRYKTADEFLEDLDRVKEEAGGDPDRTRGMNLIDGLKRETLFEQEKRIVDRRSSERRRDSRRGYLRRNADDGTRGRARFFLISLGVALLGGFLTFSLLWRINASKNVLDGNRFQGEGCPECIMDGRMETAWQGLGIGAALTAEFKRPLSANRIDLLSGSNAVSDSFSCSARPKKLVFLFNNAMELEVELADTPERQVIVMPEVLDIHSVKITVSDSYPGKTSQTVYLSEIKFWKSPVP